MFNLIYNKYLLFIKFISIIRCYVSNFFATSWFYYKLITVTETYSFTVFAFKKYKIKNHQQNNVDAPWTFAASKQYQQIRMFYVDWSNG